MKRRSPFIEFLRQERACGEALDLLRRNRITTYATAWRRCPNVRWLMWLDIKICQRGGGTQSRWAAVREWYTSEKHNITAAKYRRKFRRQKVAWLEAPRRRGPAGVSNRRPIVYRNGDGRASLSERVVRMANALARRRSPASGDDSVQRCT